MSFRVDAVEIMNRFTEYSPLRGETPLPLPIPGFWFKRICALADRVAKAENQNDDLNAQVAALTAALEEANSALISMVYQYCYRPLDANKEPAIDIYQHDFMSAGEEAFAYLVEHGLAKWTDESHYAILINSKTSLSVKSDD